MNDKPSNVIELRSHVAPGPSSALPVAAPDVLPCEPSNEPAPFAEPSDVSAIFAQLVEDDGRVFFGVLAPPVEYAGWVLDAEQAMRLGLLLLERAQRATQKP